ncbi:hypothetical protein M0R19_03280 [Candidatus Pacearchaeota archaeon]|jgi:predicted protein tyrosine phosphatase|nr:hypothetical protein [Candidatus Pacearchaeota archaeon]
MHICISSRENVLDLAHKFMNTQPNYDMIHIISIKSPGDSKVDFSSIIENNTCDEFPPTLNINYFSFDDVSSYDPYYVMFNIENAAHVMCIAAQIQAYTEERYKNTLLLIHCNQGISRSPAIAYCILSLLNETENADLIFNDRKQYSPNMHVINTIMSYASYHFDSDDNMIYDASASYEKLRRIAKEAVSYLSLSDSELNEFKELKEFDWLDDNEVPE